MSEEPGHKYKLKKSKAGYKTTSTLFKKIKIIAEVQCLDGIYGILKFIPSNQPKVKKPARIIKKKGLSVEPGYKYKLKNSKAGYKTTSTLFNKIKIIAEVQSLDGIL